MFILVRPDPHPALRVTNGAAFKKCNSSEFELADSYFNYTADILRNLKTFIRLDKCTPCEHCSVCW